MHFHGSNHLDIRLSKTDQARMLQEGKAERHLYAPQAGWVTCYIHSGEDVATAKELIMLAYDNARQIMTQHETRRSVATSKGTSGPALGVSAKLTWDIIRKL